MALYYQSSTSHTANYGGSNNSDPSIHVAEWLSYQVTDWINRIGPAYGAIKYNHEDWDAYGSFSATDYIYLQVALRGADYRAANDSGYDHGFYFRMDGGSSGYLYLYHTNFSEVQYSNNRWENIQEAYVIRDSNHLRPEDFQQPRLAQVMYSDTPDKRFFAFDIFGQRGVIHEAVDLAQTGKNWDPGWIFTKGQLIYNWHRFSPDSTAANYYTAEVRTSVSNAYTVGYSSVSSWRGILDRSAIRDYHGKYYGTTSNILYPQYSLPIGWTWTYDDRTFVSWDYYNLIEITGLTNG
jgi:hypothetical protein